MNKVEEMDMVKYKAKDNFANKFSTWIEELKASGEYYSESIRIEVAESIYELMEKQGVTKAELARRLNTSRGYITKLLQGNKNLTLDSICKVAHALGCKINNIEFVPLEASTKLENYEFMMAEAAKQPIVKPAYVGINKYKNVPTIKELILKGKNNEPISNAA